MRNNGGYDLEGKFYPDRRDAEEAEISYIRRIREQENNYPEQPYPEPEYMITVKSIKQTCSACPEQYEGFLSDGREFYVGCRWGSGYLDIPYGTTVSEKHYAGDPFRGYFEEEDLIQLFEDVDIRLTEDQLWQSKYSGYDEDELPDIIIES